MPRKSEYKRVKDGLVYAELGKVHREMLNKIVELDHSDTTKVLRHMIEQEWKRRGLPELLDVIGEGIQGAQLVPVYGVRS